MDCEKLDLAGGSGRGQADKTVAEVRELLENYSAERGPCKRYTDLIRLLRNPTTTDDTLAAYLRALRHGVVDLSADHQVLFVNIGLR
jgi:hypothetical protein